MEITGEGEAVVLALPEATYSLNTIYAASYAFLDKAYVHLDKKDGSFIVTLYPKKAGSVDVMGKAFLDEAINQGHYFSQLEKHQETTKLLVERAFFSADRGIMQKAEEEEIKELISELEKDPELKELVQDIKNDSPKIQ